MLFIESRLHLARRTSIPFLCPCNMKELTVAGLKEGNSKRKPNAHDPELGDLGGHGTDTVTQLNRDPVEMEKCDAGKTEGKTTYPESWKITLEPQENHARHHRGRPNSTPYNPPNANGIESRFRLGIGGGAKLGAHDLGLGRREVGSWYKLWHKHDIGCCSVDVEE